jgi:hypothetical protein
LQVQRVIDDWASAGERLQLAFSWTDPLATSVLLVVMLLLALGLWVLGLQILVTVGLLWVFRWVNHGCRKMSGAHFMCVCRQHGECLFTPLCLCNVTERWVRVVCGLRQDALLF